MNTSSIDLVNSISELLECKIDYDPLTKAVSLWPCLHTMDETQAVLRHGTIIDKLCSNGKIINTLCSIENVGCIICREPVVSYGENHSIRNLTNEITLLKSELDKYSQKKIKIDDQVVKQVKSISDILKSDNSFIEAVSLWPCLCTMDELTATKRHGELVDQLCSKISVECLFCKTPTISYGTNHLIRELTGEIARLETIIQEERNNKIVKVDDLNVVDIAIVVDAEEVKPKVVEVKSNEIHHRKKSRLPDEELEDYQIAHPVNYDRHRHHNFLACIGGCFGWNTE